GRWMARGARNKGVKAQAQPAVTAHFPAPEVIEVRSGRGAWDGVPAPPRAPAAFPAPEIIEVRSGRVACDGVGGALGHPRVWMEMGEAAFVECPYCDAPFLLVPDG